MFSELNKPNYHKLIFELSTKLTLADSHNSQTCRFRFTMPFSGIRCALGMLIGLKERGSGMLIAVQRTAQTNKKQKSYRKFSIKVFFHTHGTKVLGIGVSGRSTNNR